MGKCCQDMVALLHGDVVSPHKNVGEEAATDVWRENGEGIGPLTGESACRGGGVVVQSLHYLANPIAGGGFDKGAVVQHP